MSVDRYSDGAATVRSLSEQLRELEAEFGRANEMSLPPRGRRTRLPMSLGRPIGLTQPDGFPRIVTAEQETEADDVPPARGGAFRRGVAVAGAVLALFISTAILPPLIWRNAEPPAPSVDDDVPSVTSGRTDRFAKAAHDLALAPHASSPAPASLPVGAAPEALPHPRLPTVESLAPPAAAPPPSADAVPTVAESQPRQVTLLEVAESELASLNLPKIVSGVAPKSAGSAVVIDGLPDAARVSPGIRIARDSWAVGVRDVDYAVLSLPRDTPERLDLVVRVVAADSAQLAASALHIRVLRSAQAAEPRRAAEAPPVAQPKSRFEPASGLGAPGLEAIVPLPARKPALAFKPTPAPSASWPTEISSWTQVEPSAPRPAEKVPAWSPFGPDTTP